jgi:hypothetical protein
MKAPEQISITSKFNPSNPAQNTGTKPPHILENKSKEKQCRHDQNQCLL